MALPGEAVDVHLCKKKRKSTLTENFCVEPALPLLLPAAGASSAAAGRRGLFSC